VRVLATLARADAGRADAVGVDVGRDPAGVRRRIGLIGQHPAVDDALSGRQNFVLFGRLLHRGFARARARADELVSRFGLDEAAGRPVSGYSGGMWRRASCSAIPAGRATRGSRGTRWKWRSSGRSC